MESYFFRDNFRMSSKRNLLTSVEFQKHRRNNNGTKNSFRVTPQSLASYQLWINSKKWPLSPDCLVCQFNLVSATSGLIIYPGKWAQLMSRPSADSAWVSPYHLASVSRKGDLISGQVEMGGFLLFLLLLVLELVDIQI